MGRVRYSRAETSRMSPPAAFRICILKPFRPKPMEQNASLARTGTLDLTLELAQT